MRALAVPDPSDRRQTVPASIAVFLIVVLAVIAGLAIFAILPNSSITTTTTTNSYIVTSDPLPYFERGYDSQLVNFSSIRNGDVLTVEMTQIRYYIPSNLETKTTTISSTVTTITITEEYQCGISLGQRRFFEASLVNGSEFQLDYCLVLNTAIAQGAYQSSTAHSWSLWEVSKGATPTVAIHLTGIGEDVKVTELWVSK